MTPGNTAGRSPDNSAAKIQTKIKTVGIVAAGVGLLALTAALTPSWAAQPANSKAASKPGETILILDASGSMWGQVGGKAKIEIAREAVGSMLASLMTGSFVVEKIFSVPGLGRDFVSAITNRDYTMIMGTTILLSSVVIIANVIVDILYKIIGPRIKLQ